MCREVKVCKACGLLLEVGVPVSQLAGRNVNVHLEEVGVVVCKPGGWFSDK